MEGGPCSEACNREASSDAPVRSTDRLRFATSSLWYVFPILLTFFLSPRFLLASHSGFRGEEPCVRLIIDINDKDVQKLSEKEKKTMKEEGLDSLASQNQCWYDVFFFSQNNPHSNSIFVYNTGSRAMSIPQDYAQSTRTIN